MKQATKSTWRNTVLAALATVAFLCAAQTQVAAQDDGQDTRTPLHHAARDGDIDTARRLITAGADVNARANGAHTPLMAAAAYGEVEMVKFLLANRADPTLKDADGRTAAERARQNGKAAVVAVLLAANDEGKQDVAPRGQAAKELEAGERGETPNKGEGNPNQEQPAQNDATLRQTAAGCSFEPPAPKYSNSDPFSANLAKRQLYDTYNWKANGTLTAPLRVGVMFLSFQVGKPYKNIVRVDPGRGAQRINDAAPPNATIYTARSKHILCEEYNSGVTRFQVVEDYDCFKNRDGEWVCGSSGRLPLGVTMPQRID